MLGRVFSRGLLYSIGTICNKIIPESLFRFRVFKVFELRPAREQRVSGDRPKPTPSDELTFRWCESEPDFALAEELTFYRAPAGKHDPISVDPISDDPISDEYSSAEPTSSQRIRHACFAEDWARPVGGVWVGTQYFDESELGIRVQLAENQSWIFAAFVAKSHRRRGIYRRLINHVLKEQAADGKDLTSFASINPTNKASMAAHKPFIHRTIGTCIAVRLIGWTLCWANGGLSVDRHPRPIELNIGTVSR